mgnify:CR=1 FL=1
MYMSKHTKRKRCRSINNMGGRGRWGNFKRRIRNLQPHWFRTRKLLQRMNADRRAELKRDSVVAIDLRDWHARERKRLDEEQLPDVGRHFSVLRSPGRDRTRARISPRRSPISRISSHAAHAAADEFVNQFVHKITGLPLLESGPSDYGGLNLTGDRLFEKGSGVGASVMRGRIETQREERELLSNFLHDELKRMETRRLKQTQMKKSIEKKRAEEKTRKRKKKGKRKPKLERARSGEM